MGHKILSVSVLPACFTDQRSNLKVLYNNFYGVGGAERVGVEFG